MAQDVPAGRAVRGTSGGTRPPPQARSGLEIPSTMRALRYERHSSLGRAGKADLLRGCRRRRLRSAISVYPPLGLSGSLASRLGGWPTKAGKGRPQRAIGTRAHDPRRTSSRHDRTFIPRWVLHRHAVEPMVHWL